MTLCSRLSEQLSCPSDHARPAFWAAQLLEQPAAGLTKAAELLQGTGDGLIAAAELPLGPGCHRGGGLRVFFLREPRNRIQSVTDEGTSTHSASQNMKDQNHVIPQ